MTNGTRIWLAATVLALTLSCTGGRDAGEAVPGDGGKVSEPVGPNHRMNVVYVLVDDQRADSISCMPKLQEMLGNKGLTFERHYAVTPLCCPARTTQLTGKYTHNHGVRSNGDVDDDQDSVKTPGAIDFTRNGLEELNFGKWFDDAGYRTGFFGKYLNGYGRILDEDPDYVPPHWDDWHAFRDPEFFDYRLIERSPGGKTESVCYKTGGTAEVRPRAEGKCKKSADRVVDDGKENYSTDVLRDKAMQFVRDASKNNEPFLVYLALYAPHSPYESPARYQPSNKRVEFTEEAMRRLGTCDKFEWNNRPASFNEADVSDKPEWVRDLGGKDSGGHSPDPDKVREKQLVSVLANEDAVEGMIQVLKETGHDQDTIIVYVGDNGYSWGEHGWVGKNCVYEECARVPMVIYDPRYPNGRKITDYTLDIDIAPTLLDMAGVPGPEGVSLDGESVAPAFRGEPFPKRDAVVTECWGMPDSPGPDVGSAVRTDRWKYVENYPGTSPMLDDVPTETELYDLQKDPLELDNLIRVGVQKGYTQAEIDETVAILKVRLKELQRAGQPVPAEAARRLAMGGGGVAPVDAGGLTYVKGSTQKVAQLVGDVDRKSNAPTPTRTKERVGLEGAELGSSFDGAGDRTWFVFGDAIGAHGGDPIAFTTDANPEDGLDLEFMKGSDNTFMSFDPDGERLKALETPFGGIAVDGENYVAYKKKGQNDVETSHLARIDPKTGAAHTVRQISAFPGGKFIRSTFAMAPAGLEGLPDNGPYVMMWGTGRHHKSDVYFAITPVKTFGSTGDGTRYFAGMDGGKPRWAATEADAMAVATNGTLRDVEVTWIADAKQWVMLYDSRVVTGIEFRHAAKPWGPFAPEQQIFDLDTDGFGKFIHGDASGDGLAGPLFNDKNDAEQTAGMAYAPYIVDRWTRVVDGKLRIYYTMSTRNPYTVVLMRSDFTLP